MIINVIYDSSVASAPAGFTTAVQAAVQYLESVFSAPITININVGWGEVGGQALPAGVVGASLSSDIALNYTEMRNALWQDAFTPDALAAAMSLPSTDPTNGGTFLVTSAEAKALGLIDPAGTQIDGSIGLNSSTSFTFDPNNRAVPGMVDAIGVIEHEISEVLGRQSFLGSQTGGGSTLFGPLDLFRYTAPGVLAPTSANGSFSIDGQTLLTPFNNPVNGGDSGDWSQAITGNAFDAFADTGIVEQVSPTDLRLMDVLGYHPVPQMPSTPVPAGSPSTTTTIVSTSATTVAAGQTVYVTGIPLDTLAVAFELTESPPSPPPSLTNAGTIVVTNGPSDVAYGVYGFNDFVQPFINNAGGSVYVYGNSTITGRPAAVAVQSVPSVTNSGLLQAVATVGSAIGVTATGPGTSGTFQNNATGVVTVWAATTGVGVDFNLGGNFSNAGSISVTAASAIGVRGATSFSNTGTIQATGANSVAVDIYSLQNPAPVGSYTNSGTIEGTYAFLANQNYAYSPTLSITNSGRIIGAIVPGDSDTQIHNTGTIAGNIYFGDGTNLYDGSGGHLFGSVFLSMGSNTITLGSDSAIVYAIGGAGTITGGSGNDFFEISRGLYTIDGGAGVNELSFANSDSPVTVDLGAGTAITGSGTDTVHNIQEVIGGSFNDTLKAGASAATLIAGSGQDTLIGGSGNDTLVAGTGGDTITGGGGNNTFIYSSGDHQAVITDFRANGDNDVLKIYGYASPVSVTQQGADTLISLSANDSILLKGVQASSLTPSEVVYNAAPYASTPVPGTPPPFGTSTIFLNEDLTIGATEVIHETAQAAGFVDRWKSLDNFGTVAVTYSSASDTVYGVALDILDKNAKQLTGTPTNTIANEAGAKLTVSNASGAAIGFADDVAARITNAGDVEVTAAGAAEGFITEESNLTNSAFFDNSASGSFQVTSTGGRAIGLDFKNGGSIENDGSFVVSGGADAFWLRMTRAELSSTITNKGMITVTAGPSGQSYGIAIGGVYYLGGSQPFNPVCQINNSGTITAQKAIYEFDEGDSVLPGTPKEPRVNIVNSGTINGDIVLGPGPDTIQNTGTIDGNIYFGQGIFGGIQNTLTSTGTINGTIFVQDDPANIDLRGGHFSGTISIAPSGSGVTSDTIYTGTSNALIQIQGGDPSLSVIINGNSQNVVQFDVASTQVTITGDANSSRVTGPDGTEFLSNISTLQFTDKTLHLHGPQTDFRGAGLSDILWHDSTTGQNGIWQSNGNGTFSIVPLSATPAEWSVVGIGDFNGDGKSDILWHDSNTGQNGIWQSNGDGTFSTFLTYSTPSEWSVVGIGDFNGDGKSDILWHDSVTGQNGIWQSNGNGAFSTFLIPSTPSEWHVVGIGDFNGDGKSDLLWHDSVTGQNGIWQSNGNGTFSIVPLSATPSEWSVVGIGDFNGDGKSDILWHDSNTGQNGIWQSNGNGTFSTFLIYPTPAEWSVTGIGDFNGDGKSDILWHDSTTGQNGIWESNGDGTFSTFLVTTTPSEWSVVPANAGALGGGVSQPAASSNLVASSTSSTRFTSDGSAPSARSLASTIDWGASTNGSGLRSTIDWGTSGTSNGPKLVSAIDWVTPPHTLTPTSNHLDKPLVSGALFAAMA